MLALLRVFYSIRIQRCFSELEENEKINFIVVRIARMMWVCYLVCHYGGCVFYLLAASHRDAKNTWFSLVDPNFVELGFIQRYVTSMYLAVISFTTVGYGDLHPISTDEMVFSVIFLLIDFGLIAYVTTTVIYLVLPDIGLLGKYRARRVRVLAYCRHYHLSDDICKEVSDHLKLEYQSRAQPSEENGILNSLPIPVKGKILNALSTKLTDNRMLNRLSNPIRFQLIQAMEPVMFPANTSIILQNEAPMFLYFVLSGSVDLNTGGGQPVDTVTSGEVFGETCVFFNRPQAFTATTSRLSQLLMMDRVKLMSILQSCPKDTSSLISGHLEDLNTKPYLNEVRSEFENNARTIGRIDLPVSLLFAVERRYSRLFDRLVEEYPDPNERDSSGRTLLHLLASRNDIQKCRKLIDIGANPNLTDSSGNYPLQIWNNNGDDA
ncbi:hypothetical protein TSUD_194270 [Trifolium subterraneum]|uniref:Potassium channel n=1 Tax=Trifolium subterraneum TaxID=3900 RepID=A0A2Z6NM40_TRISU|nr:hypothetical protein TSUD_194270 [Trifolium subterraneum]